MKINQLRIIKNLFFICCQIICTILFWQILFSMEVSLLGTIFENEDKFQNSIHQFLSGLQYPFLPQYFFISFFPLFILSVSFILFKKWRWYFISLFGILLSSLIIADKIYYSFFSSFISVNSLASIGNVWGVKSSILEAIKPNDYIIILVFFAFAIFGVIYNKNISSSLSDNPSIFISDKILGIVIFLLAIYCYNIAFYIPKRYVEFSKFDSHYVLQVSTKPIKSESQPFIPLFNTSNKHFAVAFGLINFHIQNIIDYYKTNINVLKLSESETNEVSLFLNHKKNLNATHSPFYGIAKGRNVFLIHFESLNPIMIGQFIDNVPITPTLNKFINNGGLYWHNILDQILSGGSSDSEFSALTGLLSSINNEIRIYQSSTFLNLHSLPHSLKSCGYDTISLHGNYSSFYDRNVNHPLLGFNRLFFSESFFSPEKLGMGVPDKDFFSQSVDLLINNNKFPFFAYLISLSSHHPYSYKKIPEIYQNLFMTEQDYDSDLFNYFRMIRYTDDALGDFFSKIHEVGLWDNSIFVIYGDHKPVIEKSSDEILIKLTGKSLSSLRSSCVPIIIIIPGEELFIIKYKDQYENIVGGLYDIYPTILHLLGLDIPIGIYGTHLFVNIEKRDPIPMVKQPEKFVYNGICYSQFGEKAYKDEFGLIFHDDPTMVLSSPSDLKSKYFMALQAFRIHNFIFNANIDLTSIH